MLAPTGCPAPSEKMSVCPASGSVAVAVKVRSDPAVTVWFPIGVSTGQWFSPAALTVTVKV